MHPALSLMASRSDEHERFVSLYERHAGAVLAYARRRCGSDEAEDVLAETFLVVWRRRHDVPADALPWLYAVAGNLVRNRARSERRRVALEARLAAEPVVEVEPDGPDPRLRAASAAGSRTAGSAGSRSTRCANAA
jgi:DNA-directed RNA polymerase specialized sigma24 family protein